MKTRIYTAIGYGIGGILILLALATVPIWIFLWIVFDYNITKYLMRKFNSETDKRIAELNKRTGVLIKESEELLDKIEKENAERKNIDRLKREN